MVETDLTTPVGFLSSLWQLLGGVLRLDPDAFVAAGQSEERWQMALVILFVGGLSDMLGQSVVLFVNRVSPRRFVLSLTMAAVMLVTTVFFWAASIWLIALIVFDTHQSLIDVLSVVGLSYAPLLFGFLVLMPHFGIVIYRLLRIWILLALLVGVGIVYRFGFWETLFCCGLGWILFEVVTRLPILQIKRLKRWWWRTATGVAQPANIQELADQVAEQVRLSLSQQMVVVRQEGRNGLDS